MWPNRLRLEKCGCERDIILLLADALAELVEAVDAEGAYAEKPGSGPQTGGGQVTLQYWSSC